MKNDLDDLYRRSYRELLRAAAAALRRDPRASLSPGTLVHEVWMRLAAGDARVTTSPSHFKAIAARVMRRILIDAARRRHALRRGGPRKLSVTFDDDALGGRPHDKERLLDVDEALTQLGKVKPRLESVAELFFFAGCTGKEVAAALQVSESAVDRDLRFIRAWLGRRFG